MKIRRGDILYADLGVRTQQQQGEQAQHRHYSGSAVH